MSEAVVTPRLSRKRIFSGEKQTNCLFCNKPCDEDRNGFPLDFWNDLNDVSQDLPTLPKSKREQVMPFFFNFYVFGVAGLKT